MGLSSVTLNPGAGGNEVAVDTVSAKEYQLIKLIRGASGAADFIDQWNGQYTQPVEACTDAFGRMRVSNPTAIFSAQLQYDQHRIQWESSLTGSATDTHDGDGSCTDMAVTASASDTAIRQTRRYFRYQPGKSQLILSTGTFGTAAAGIDHRMGYFDAENGVFLELTGTTLNVVQRSKVSGSVVDTAVAQASWNVDVMDGTGRSGTTLDITKAQIFTIDLEWLSVGRVRVGFVIDGAFQYVHEFKNANSLAGAYMTTANLPMRYELDNTTGANTGTLKVICSSVISEGGLSENQGIQFCATNGNSFKTIGTTENAAISIRPKATFNSIANRGQIIPEQVTGFTEDKTGTFEVYYGATLGGVPSWTSVNADSICEYDVAGTTITGGILLASYSVERSGVFNLPENILEPLTLDISGGHPTSPYSDVLTVSFISRTATSDVTASIIWREVR